MNSMTMFLIGVVTGMIAVCVTKVMTQAAVQSRSSDAHITRRRDRRIDGVESVDRISAPRAYGPVPDGPCNRETNE